MTKVKVIFSVLGDDFRPDVITSSLSINPTNVWIKGEKISNRHHLNRKESCWQLSTDYQDSLDIEEQFRFIYNSIKVHEKKLMKLINEHNLSAKFEIVVKIEDKNAPGMTLTKDILNLAHRLGAEFDFDIYVE